MRSKTGRLIVAGLVAAAPMVLPAHSANAWVAAGGWCHPHVAVYHPRPCYGGVAAAAVAGIAVGAAVASRPVYVAPAPTVIVTAPAPAPAPVVVVQPAAVGEHVTVLPPGAKSLVVNGAQYYQAGSTWYHPAFGNNGVYYTIVPTP